MSQAPTGKPSRAPSEEPTQAISLTLKIDSPSDNPVEISLRTLKSDSSYPNPGDPNNANNQLVGA